jgi:phospholipase/lecithinase/hemolysin
VNADPESRKARITEWNRELLQFITGFQRRHRDIYTYLYDSAPVFNAILDQPARYGFKDTISECLQEDCVWWDEAHPAFGLHRILAQDMALFLDKL